MKFEALVEGDETQINLEFEVGDTAVLQAAYRERIARLACDATVVGAGDDFDAQVAGWNDDTAMTITTPNPINVSGELEAFHENTPTAVNAILAMPGVPIHENVLVTHIPRRVSLGTQALALAQEIRRELAVHVFVQGMADDSFNNAAGPAAA